MKKKYESTIMSVVNNNECLLIHDFRQLCEVAFMWIVIYNDTY